MHGLNRLAVAFEHPSPAKVVDEILGRYTVKSPHPILEAAVIGIDVLDMEGAIAHPLSRPGMHDLVCDAGGAGKCGIHSSTVRTERRLLIDQRLEHGPYMPGVEFIQFEIGGVSFAVSNHHHRNLVLARPPGCADAAPFTRWPRQVALAFEGFEKEGLIDLDEACFMRITMLGDHAQEAMPPQEGRVLADATALRRGPDTESLDQRLGIVQPAICLARCARGVELKALLVR